MSQDADSELPPLPRPRKAAVFATAANTKSVRDGYEMGGYEKEPALFDEDQVRQAQRGAIKAVRENLLRAVKARDEEIERRREEVAEWKARADNLATALRNCLKLAYNCHRDELPSAIITTASKAVAEYDMQTASSDPPGDGQQLTDEQLRRIIVSVWKGDPAIESVQWWDNLMRLARAIEAVRRTPPMMPSLPKWQRGRKTSAQPPSGR